jgi:hypothetical protein
MAAIEMESIEPPRTAAALAHARRKKSGKTRSTSQKDLPRSHNHDESNFKQRKRPFKPRNLDGDSAVGIEPNLLASNALAEPHTQGVNLLKRIGWRTNLDCKQVLLPEVHSIEEDKTQPGKESLGESCSEYKSFHKSHESYKSPESENEGSKGWKVDTAGMRTTPMQV